MKRRLVIGTAAVAVIAAGGGAYAAMRDTTNPRQAFLNDVAKRLHVTPQQLQAALRGAFLDRLAADVAAGRLTQAQANAIKQRVQRSGFPLLGPGPLMFGPPFQFGGPHFFQAPGPSMLSAAAAYLGLSDTQLLDRLGSGKSLAQIARSRGKSVAGLKSALVTATRTRLDGLVSKGVITRAQEQQLLSRLSARLDREIARAGLAGRPGFGPRFGFGLREFHRGIAVPPPGAESLPPGPASLPPGPPPGPDPSPTAPVPVS